MAKKKRVKKVSRKPVAKKVQGGDLAKRRIIFVLKDLFFFLVLFLVSIALYNVSVSENYVVLFALLSIVFGFVTLTFLIVLLVLLFIQFFKKD